MILYQCKTGQMSISQTRYVVEHILQIEKVRTTTRKAEERELNSI